MSGHRVTYIPPCGISAKRGRRDVMFRAVIASMVAIIGWAATASSRMAALEANEVAHEKAESDANQYRQGMSELRDPISRIEGYLKRLTQ